MKLKWFIKSACALALAVALAFSFSTVLAKPKQSKKTKLWYYEKDMLSTDFNNYAYNSLARITNTHGTGALTDDDYFLYNGTLIHSDNIADADDRINIEMNYFVRGSVPKNYLNFKVSKKDKVNYVWGVSIKDAYFQDNVGRTYFNVHKDEPFHILGIAFSEYGIHPNSPFYIVETKEDYGFLPMAWVKIIQK